MVPEDMAEWPVHELTVTSIIGETVLVNVGVVDEKLRPALVLDEQGGLLTLQLFVHPTDTPLAYGVGIDSRDYGYFMGNVVEGKLTRQWRRRFDFKELVEVSFGETVEA